MGLEGMNFSNVSRLSVYQDGALFVTLAQGMKVLSWHSGWNAIKQSISASATRDAATVRLPKWDSRRK